MMLVLFTGCSSSDVESDGNISGEVIFQDGQVADTIYVNLYSLTNFRIRNIPIQSIRTKERTFSFDVEPGRYMIWVLSYGCESYREDIYIHTKDEKVRCEINLPRRGFPDKIRKVALHGEFNGWGDEDGPELEEENGVWRLQGEIPLRSGDVYAFVMNDELEQCEDISNPVYTIHQFNFRSVYQGGEIAFDSKLYIRSDRSVKAKTSGSEFNRQFKQVQEDLSRLELHEEEVAAEMKTEPSKAVEKFEDALALGERLKNNHTELFQPIIDEWAIWFYFFGHPMGIREAELYKSEEPDSAGLEALLSSDLHKDLYKGTLDYLNRIDPRSKLLTETVIQPVLFLDIRSRWYPEALENLGFDRNHIYNQLIAFINKCDYDVLAAGMLYTAADHYLMMQEPDRASELTALLSEKYPEDRYNRLGHAERLSRMLNMGPGYLAPQFELEALSGEIIRLSDYHGKFVFIDFWGSWCAPCRAELPNIRTLATSIPEERLQVLGIIEDDEATVRKFLEKEPLPYPNAMRGDSTLQDWGILAYPTTFLIDPEGAILAKNLRGEDLVDLVRAEMEQSEHMRSQ